MFSSIPEEKRTEVIKTCYWPLLKLAESGFKICIEAPALTLEIIQSLDPNWINEVSKLMAENKIEFIGSGYSQIIGPLVPAGVNEWNLEVGKSVYKKLLGVDPDIWYVNEQAYSMSMVDHYVNIGARAIINEWNNAGSIHSEWPKEYRFFPQVVSGHHHTIPVIWNDSITFQKFQRYAHNDLDLDEYLNYVQSLNIPNNGVHCLYGNDAETFDFRPGRFITEAKVEIGEWKRINDLYKHLSNHHQFIFPSEILAIDNQSAFNSIELQSSDMPIPVKKQPKYNITRWALTGRDNCGINSKCYALFKAIQGENNGAGGSFDEKKALLYAFSSDFRTHITEKRWDKYGTFLNELTNKFSLNKNKEMVFKWKNQSVKIEPCNDNKIEWINDHKNSNVNDINHRLIEIKTPTMSVVLNKRKGLAIESCSVNNRPLFGTISHGFYEDMDLAFDWFSGNTVIKRPGKPQITDLMVPSSIQVSQEHQLQTAISCKLDTSCGQIIKTITVYHKQNRMRIDYSFHFDQLPLSSFHLNQCTLFPDSFDQESLFYATHNGGYEYEEFLLNKALKHYQHSSSVVSASHALGATEGITVLGDQSTVIAIITDRSKNGSLPMIEHRITNFGRYFTRLVYSLGELDESRKMQNELFGEYAYDFVIFNQ